jgi:uncharacterized protein (TIGR00730 family)
MGKKICVYASSSDGIPMKYHMVVEELGSALANDGWDLVFGGGKVGLMGTIAKAMVGKSKLIGVLPDFLHQRGLAFDRLNQLIITKDMQERKAVMASQADAFIALPGGWGTLEEIMEILTLKQLQLHTKPIVFLNYEGFYDSLISFFEKAIAEQFIKPSSRTLFFSAIQPHDIIEYLNRYQTPIIEQKWF